MLMIRVVQEHWENQKVGKWVDPESDEDTEDAVGLRMYVRPSVSSPSQFTRRFPEDI